MEGRPEWVWPRPDTGTRWLVYDRRGVGFVVNDNAGIVTAISVFRPGTARTFMTIP
jgi:hypothetical protein